jgi:uncharacterized glyoxalase superfamily protein PhnB
VARAPTDARRDLAIEDVEPRLPRARVVQRRDHGVDRSAEDVREIDGAIGQGQMTVGEGAIMLGRQGADYYAPTPGVVHQYVHVTVEDAARHYERARRAGARILSTPHDMPFGERQYVAEDPEGAPLDLFAACRRCAAAAVGGRLAAT